MSKEVVKCKADIFWCNHLKQADLSEKYEVTLANLSGEATAALEDLGITVRSRKDRPEWGNFICVRSNFELPIENIDGQPITTLIGNESKGIAVIGKYEWNYKKEKGVSPTLLSLLITDLKVYESGVPLAKDDSVAAL